MGNITTTEEARLIECPKDKDEELGRFVWILGGMAVIGGFLFGYDTGVVSGALLYVSSALELDYLWSQLVVSTTVGACAVSSAAAGPLNDRFGRKPVIIATSAIFSVGAVLLASAQNKEMLLVARIVVGLGVGASSATIPPYLAEAAPTSIRGRLVTCFQLMVTFGFFLASVLGGAFSYIQPYKVGWRLMFGVAGIPAVVQLVGFFYLPESPRWLMGMGREDDARRVLRRICGPKAPKAAELELVEIRESLAKDAGAEGATEGWVLMRMLRTPPVRKALILGCSLQIFQQLSGVNTIMFYTASIIRMSGIRNPSDAIWMSCAVTGVNFLFTLLPMWLIERLGRRKLLLYSIVGVFSSCILLGVGFILINNDCPNVSGTYAIANMANQSKAVQNINTKCNSYTRSDDCVTQEQCGFCFPVERNASSESYGWCLQTDLGVSSVSKYGPCSNSTLISNEGGRYVWAWNFCPTHYAWMPILGMVAFLSSFSTGLAPIPWVMNSEIYPNWARSTGVSCATTANWVANLVISQTFLTLTESITKYGTFFLFAAVTLVSFVVFYFTVPETMGVAVEDVEELFGGKPRSVNGYENRSTRKLSESKF